jgi:FkbH-like protein
MSTSRKIIKCVVWDLDHTLWNGVLLEDAHVELRPGALEAVRTFDERGILQSIASRNDRDLAMQRLQHLGLAEYFLHPQIHWNSKVSSLENIARSLNIALDTFAFIDDDPFERDQIQFAHPDVHCFDPADMAGLTALPELKPLSISGDARLRRRMYLEELDRNKAEEMFDGPQEEFLATLGMVLTIAPADLDDLTRAEELVVRTHQLNTTGYTYSQEELAALLSSPHHMLLMASLEDRYGSYGKVGLALIEVGSDGWTLKLLLMSCRVAARGAGSLFTNYICRLARERGVRLMAEFLPNDRNRQMYVTFKFSGFRETGKRGPVVVLENDFSQLPPLPDYVTVVAQGVGPLVV